MKKLIITLAALIVPILIPLSAYADSSGISTYWYTADYDFDHTVDYTSPEQSTDSFNIEKNGSYVFYAKDVAGNISEMYSYDVTNIDNSDPECEIEFIGDEVYKKLQSLTFTLNDNMALGELKILKGTEVLTTETYEWTQAELESCTPTTKTKTIAFNANGTYTWKLTDYAGNESTGTFIVNNIDTAAPTNSTFNVTSVWTQKDQVEVTITDAYGSIDKVAYDGNAYSVLTTGNAYNKVVSAPIGTDMGKELIDVVSTSESITYEKLENELIARPSRVEEVTLKFTWLTNGTHEVTVYDTAGNQTIITFEETKIDRAKPVIEGISGTKTPSKESVNITINAHDE